MAVLSRVQERQSRSRSLSAVRVGDLTLYRNRYGGDPHSTVLHVSDRPVLLPRAQRVEGFVEGTTLTPGAYSHITRYTVTAEGRVRQAAVNWTGSPMRCVTATPSLRGSCGLVEVPTFVHGTIYKEVSVNLDVPTNGNDTMYYFAYWHQGSVDPNAFFTIERRVQGSGDVTLVEVPVPGAQLRTPFTLSATAYHYLDRVDLTLYIDGVSVLSFSDTSASRIPPGRAGFDIWTGVGSAVADVEISRAALGEITAYLPLVQDWGAGSGDEMQVLSPGTSSGTASLKLSNQCKVPGDGGDRASVERFTDLIRHGGNVSGFDPSAGDLAIDWLPTDYHAIVGYDSQRVFEGPVETIYPSEWYATVSAKSLMGSMVMDIPEVGARCAAPITDNYESDGQGFEVEGVVTVATMLPTSSEPMVPSEIPAMMNLGRYSNIFNTYFTLIDHTIWGPGTMGVYDNRLDAFYRNLKDHPHRWLLLSVICARHQSPTDADYPGCNPAGPSPVVGEFCVFKEPSSLLELEGYHAGVWGQRPQPVVDRVLWQITNADYQRSRMVFIGSSRFMGLALRTVPAFPTTNDPNAQTFTEIDVWAWFSPTSSTSDVTT